MNKQVTKPQFEVGDHVRPHTGIHINEMGTVKDINMMILSTQNEPSYKVQFAVKSQFGYPDYEYSWFTEHELQAVVPLQMGFHPEVKNESIRH